MNGTPDSPGRTLVAVLGFASAGLLGFAALGGGIPQDLGPFLALLVLAACFECASVPLRGFGYVGLSFFVCLAAIIRPPLLHGGSLPGVFGILSQALLIAFCSSLGAWGFRYLAGWERPSTWLVAADTFTHVVRVAVAGLVVLHVPGLLDPDPGAAQAMNLFTGAGLVGMAAGAGCYWLTDRLLTSRLVATVAGDEDHKTWQTVHVRTGALSAGSLGVGAWLAMAAALGISVQLPQLGATWILVLGLVAGGLPVVIMNRAIGATGGGLEEEEKEVLEAALRGARGQIETLTRREEALSRTVQKKSEDLDMLFGMARDLGAATNLQDTLDIVVRMIRGMGIPFQSCVVFILQEGHLLPVKSQTPFKEVLEMAHLLQLEEPLVREAVKARRTQMSADVRSSSEQRIFKDERSVLCAPLIVSKEPVGVIYVGARSPATYSEDAMNTLTMLAAHAAPSIQTARLFESKEKDLEEERRIRTQVEAQKNQLEGLQNMVQSISRELRQEHSLEVVLGAVCELIPRVQSVIVLLEDKTDERESRPEAERFFVPAIFRSPYQAFVKDLGIRPGEGFLGQVLLHRSRIVVNDFREYSHENILTNELAAMAAPLTAEDELLGCLYVGSPNRDAFSDADLNLLQTIASQASLALKNARLMDQTRQQALTDGLTGLYTHRFFKEQLKIQVDDARRTGKPACLVLLDTDKFKQYNDTLGHPAGDALLKEIAAILRDSVRTTDIVCRQGGDEFAIIMRESPKPNAIEVAQRIRETFELRFADREVRVTASIGVSCFPVDAPTQSELVQRADEALYRAKNTGRNRVSVAPSLDGTPG